MERNFYWFVLFFLLLATGLNFFLTHVFITFEWEDYLNYPLFELVVALFSFSIFKHLLLTVYFWRKGFRLLLISNFITAIIYLWNIWQFYQLLTDVDVSRREQMYAEKALFWMTILTGALFAISVSRANFWLRIYGVAVILFEVIDDLLVRTRYYDWYNFQAYLSCSIVIFLAMNFLSELNKLKPVDQEIIDN